MGERCACGTIARYTVKAASSEPVPVCGPCAERAPFTSIVRRIEGVSFRGPRPGAVVMPKGWKVA
jgi:hypothetical protein